MGLLSSHYFVVHGEPLVVACSSARDVRKDIDLLRRISERPIVLDHLSWWAGEPTKMQSNLEKQRSLTELGVEHHLIVNAPEEEKLMRELGIRGAWCSKNIYCNERSFDLAADTAEEKHSDLFARLGVEGKFDAIAIAQIAPYKRLELAQNVERLMIIGYGGKLSEVYPELSHVIHNKRWMPEWAVSACVRQSHCGLALSEIEGQNNATVEYLLCGVPVVSTPSKGGRDLFLDTGNSLIAAPTPDDVAEAVAHFKRTSVDKVAIREGTLGRLHRWRSFFCRYVSEVLGQRGVRMESGRLMTQLFLSKDISDRMMPPRRLLSWLSGVTHASSL